MDDEAARISDSTPQISGEMAELEMRWGEEYMIGHDEERGWWAARRDGIGRFFTAPSPGELQKAIVGECQTEHGHLHQPDDGGNS